MAQDVTLSVGGDFGPLDKQAQQALKRLQATFEKTGKAGSKSTHVLGSGLSAATAKANEFEKSMNAAYARVIAFGASAGIIVKVQQAFSNLVKSTIEVEKSLKDINVILGASSKGLEKFSSGLFKVAKDTGQTFETVAAAATELSRQGLSAEKTLQRTKDAMILARLAGMDAVGAVEALTATLNTFNKAGLDSTKVVNKLAKVDAAFAVSSQDLAQALQRVGASAKGAGVSFDELLAIVTAAQQKTARGGAVIGNSFKTIFTRIQRPEVLNQLERLGIAVRDVEGNTLPAIRILNGLARTYDGLTSVQKSVISEQVAGVFQINILKAALGDLNSEYSIYQGALRAASSATNEATQRNAELNKTVSALLNQTTQAFKEFGAVVGGATIAPAIKNILTPLTAGLEAITTAAGTDMGKALLDGLGKFIGGPGLALVGVITGRLLAQFASFAKEALQVFRGRNTAALQTKNVEQDILTIMRQQLATQRQMGAGRGRGRVGNFALATTPVRAGGEGMIPNFSNAFATMTPSDLRRMASGKRNPENVAGAKAELVRRNLPLKGSKRSSVSSNSTLLAYSGKAPSSGMGSYTFTKTKSGSPVTVQFPVATFKKDLEPSPGLQKQVEDFADKTILSFASRFKPAVSASGLSLAKSRSDGYQGALASTVGTMFESGMRLAFGNSIRSTSGGAFDIASIPTGLAKFFDGVVAGPKGDFKNSLSDGNRKSFATKIAKDQNLPIFAKALTPNFSALSEAIAREKAAGIPAGAIRVGRSSQLASASNPQGLAVYNTIDEPRGLSQGINRYKSAGLDPKSAGMPNFFGGGFQPMTPESRTKPQEKAAKKLEVNNNKAAEASGKLADRMLALSFGMQMVLSTIQGFGFKPESTAGRAGLGAATGAATGAGIGAAVGGPYGAIAGLVVGGTIGAVAALDDSKEKLEQINNKFGDISTGLTGLSSALAGGDRDQIFKSFSALPPELQKAVGGLKDLSQESIAAAQAFATTQQILNVAAVEVTRRPTGERIKEGVGGFLKGAQDLRGGIARRIGVENIPLSGIGLAAFLGSKFLSNKHTTGAMAEQITDEGVMGAAGKFYLDDAAKTRSLRQQKSGRAAARGLAGVTVKGESISELFAIAEGRELPDEAIEEFYGGSAMGIASSRQLIELLKDKESAFTKAFVAEMGQIGKQRVKFIEEFQAQQTGLLGEFLGEFRFTADQRMKFLSDGVKDVANTMKSSFKDGFKAFIDGSKSASEAFRSFATTVLDKILDMSLSYGTNSLFAALGMGVGTAATKGGGNKFGRFLARGGMVTGGSGVRDDVPAMLTGGEFVVKKSAVDALGVGFMNRINSYAEGGVVGANRFEMGTLGTRGKFNVGSGLSSLAITSTSNPQNALRSEMAQADEQRVTRYQEYIERKRQAMEAFKAQKSQKRIGAVMNAAMILGASALAQRRGRVKAGELEVEGIHVETAAERVRDNARTAAEQARDNALVARHSYRQRVSPNQGGTASTAFRPQKPLGTSPAPMPTSFSGGGGGGAAAMLAASIQQLSASIQSGGSAGGGETSVNLTFNIDKSGNTKSEQNTEKKTGQPSSTEDQEKEKQFGEMIKSVVLDTITQQKRPGGLLFKAN
ncbi:MAG: phage tail tape measure protein [Bacteroidetes bacterium]|nr:MAG: phage tail tape measure protein [Bacteroidota bacterium]